MSDSGKSVRPIRQLSLQPPAPRRQLIRRQRSAEEEKSLQICVSSLARGKRGKSAKPTFERPKVRVAWKENRGKNEKETEQVEVVARQIPGRSRPNTGRSRGFVAIDKPSILYSREELAERLRLAWKHRQENKANINIFLAHGFLEERCDSEMSSHATITAPSSPILQNDGPKLKTTLSEACKVVQDESFQVSRTCTHSETKKEIRNDLPSDFERHNFDETKQIEINEVSGGLKKTGQEKSDVQQEAMNEILASTNIDECRSNSKKKTSINIECSNPRVPTKVLPSIKIENLPFEVEKVSKEDFSSAKQKRASFHSGTNRAFLEPIKSPTIEFRCNSSSEKDRATAETKEKPAVTKNISERTQKSVADGKSKETMIDRSGRTRMFAESKESLTDNKSTNDANKYNLTIKRATTNTIAEDKDCFVVDKIASASNSVEVRCSSVNERNVPSKKTEIQKVEQKPRRTSSAPPQRLVESNLSNSRVQVNIVIDTQNNRASGRSRDQEKAVIDCKDNAIEKADTKVSSGRSVRSAPLKRRSRSAKRRFWGSAKNDEEGKSRNRSSGRAKSSIDSKTIDIITMVSLVSSADSDSDIENSPRDDKLINELRNKLPTTSIIKTSMNPLSSLRKPIKSVSFQKDSFDEDSPKEQQPSPKQEKKTSQPRLAIVNHRGNGGILSSNEETVSWRTEIPDLTVPVLSLIHDAEETLDVPLTDREKRCLAVPIGDLHDKKRKLLKTRSISSRSEMERQTILSKTKIQNSPNIVPQNVDYPAQVKTCSNNTSANVKSIFISPSKETVQPVEPISTEPRFQTNKEKECWHLYRKMCDKGVCVSFDTVLRGMLTPTEYRLRQKELSQDL